MFRPESAWWLLGICATILLSAATTALGAQPSSWTLSTDDTRITLAVANGQPVVQHLRAPRSKHNWLATGAPVPLMPHVWLGGREFTTQWLFAGAKQDRRAGTLTLTFTNSQPRLLLRSIWRARSGHGPVEHWMELVNNSGERVTVSHQDSLALAELRPGASANVWWIKRGGSNASSQGGTFVEPLAPELNLNLVSNCEDGASPVPWLAVQVGDSHGLYVGWEFSGLGRIAAKATDGGAAFDLRVGNQPDFKTDVEPGETFLVPPAFVGCYTGDIDDGSYTLHRWVIEKLRPRMPEGVADPTLAYNLYLDAGGASAHEADVLRSAAFCRDLGFETFMPDAMWFPECGDWRWDPRRFPRGIAPIESFVHRSGMKLALWCAWSNGGISEHPDALSVRGSVGHPDWFNADFKPDWKPSPFYGGQICLGSREAKEWAIRKTQWLVGRHRLDYLKHDIGPIVTQCNKTTHRHRYGVDASYWAARGYYEVREQLRRAFPQLVLENCSGGGHIKDYGAMARTHYIVTTDTLSNLPDRQSIYDSTFALPPLVLQAYTYEREYKVPGDDPGAFLWRSAMMGAWQIDPTNTRIWTDEERASAKRAAAIYRERIRPLLRDVRVHHILPRPDGKRWDGMFYWSSPARRGTLYVFRPDAGEAEQAIKLKGLQAAKRYRLWCEDGSVEPGVRTGAELMKRGLTVRLADRYTSDLIYVQEAALPSPKGFAPPGRFHLQPPQTASDAFNASAKLSWTASAHARSYRVAVADSADFSRTLREQTVLGTSLALTGLPAGRTLTWRVEAIAWGGRRVNESGAATLATPKSKDLSGVVFVSDLPWVRATAGVGNPVRRDTNYYGGTIRVGGRDCQKGVWTHAFNDPTPADLVVDISQLGVVLFAADTGVETAAGNGTVQFQVLADGALRAESPVLKQGEVHRFRMDVAGVKQVTLRVLNGGDDYTCDHAAWGLARFIKAGATDPLENEH
ncbi:MAG: NPCBM/NEW2 domain-containing protein [Verrucomicrobia bacterium]|nr:NPCBM/NEW2 domain-containing protein [Verrucomicrobiota bacterium]